MGSSKHSNDKDKERDKKRNKDKSSKSKRSGRSRSREKGRDRSRSRERGRDRSKSRERRPNRSTSRERKKNPRKDRDRSRDRGVSKRERLSDHRDRKKSHRHEERDAEGKRQGRKGTDTPTKEVEVEEEKHSMPMEVKLSSSGDVASLSIEQTNKLRISLGLKPLQVEGAANDGSEDEAMSKKEPTLVIVKNIGEEKEREKLKEKMATMKETRRLMKALNSVRSLGERKRGGTGDNLVLDEDAISWVENMRKKDEAKRMAEKKAKMLAEMDEEFGVGDLISEVITHDRSKAYGSHDLRGVKVEHDVSAFKDGMDVTLVIKDTDVLDESDPVLMNLNLLEAEQAAKNVEVRKKTSVYNPYQEEEVDELGNVKKTDILNKYDEEIHGERKKAFIIGEGGSMDMSAEKEKEIIRQRLLEKSITLSTGPSQLSSEYFTNEEMVSFKKLKKRKKVRKKEKVKADDLLPMGDDDISKDHGSRSHDKEDADMEVDGPVTGDIDLRDELDSSVTSALARTRQLLHRSKEMAQGTTGAAKVAAMLQRVKGKEPDGARSSTGAIILDKTSEFCKQVGEDREELKEHARRKSLTDRNEDLEEDDMEVEEDEEGGWKEVRELSRKKEKPKADDLYQEAEPLVATGIVATLQLASKKGFVNVSVNSSSKKGIVEVTTSSAGRRDIEYERQKEKERDRELSRYGRDCSFPEKKDYVPNVAIEYVDDNGRLLSTKEAFRFMSHKFHGRTSGRKKMDKRLKKIQEEKLLSSASSTDTPLNTLAVLKSKQKSAQSPYILISGGAQSLLAPDIAKRK